MDEKRKIGKANEKRKMGKVKKRAKDGEVNGQGREEEGRMAAPTQGTSDADARLQTVLKCVCHLSHLS